MSEPTDLCAYPTCGCARSQHYDDAAEGRGHCHGCCEPEDTDTRLVCAHRFKEPPSPDPIYGRWFDAKEVPVTKDVGAWIVTANRSAAGDYAHVSARSAGSYFGALARMEPPAEVWMRIPPPPWLA